MKKNANEDIGSQEIWWHILIDVVGNHPILVGNHPFLTILDSKPYQPIMAAVAIHIYT